MTFNKDEIKNTLAKKREKNIDWYLGVCKKILKRISWAMALMLVFDILFLAASLYFGTDFYGFVGTSVIVLLELIAYLYASIKKFNFSKKKKALAIAFIQLLPIASFVYFGLYLGFTLILALVVIRIITVSLFLSISLYKVKDRKKKEKALKVGGKKTGETYYAVRTPFGKKFALFVSFVIFCVSVCSVVMINAGSGAMYDFTRRVSYTYSEEEGALQVNKVLDGLAPLEIKNEATIISLQGFKTYPVTSIKAGAFDGIKYLNSVKIPSGIKNIENGAFSNSSIEILEIDATDIKFNNSLENTSISEISFLQSTCKNDLTNTNVFGVNKISVEKENVNDFRKQYSSIEALFAPKVSENEIYINFNNTVIDTLISEKGEDGSLVVYDPFGGQQPYDKVENGRSYKLIWWNEINSDSTTKIDFPYTTTESMNLFAEWVPIFNIEYDIDDGTPQDELVYSLYYSSGDVSVPSASKEGYTFMGWFDNQEFKGESILSISDETKADVKLYAKFLKNYNISYDLGYDGATVPGEYEVLYHQETPNITFKEPTRRGYSFNGWYTVGDSENKISVLDCSQGGNVSIVAKWDIITYNVTYVSADLVSGLNQNVKEYTVETEDVSLEALALSGYKFIGWYTSQSFDAESLVDSVAIPKGSIDEKVFYAKWELDSALISNESGYNGTYDGISHEIKIDVSHNAPVERNVTYSYQWYKDGEKLNVLSNASHLVANHLESGKYVCEVVASDGEYTATAVASQKIDVLIAKADYDMSGISYVDLTKIYDGNMYIPEIDGELPVGMDGIKISVSYSEGAINVTDSGKEVLATFTTESTNYNVPAEMSAKIIIEPAKITGIQMNAYSAVYDGKEHDSVVPSADTVNAQPVIFTYSLSLDGEYTNEIPQIKNNGNLIVYYKVSAPNHSEESGNYYVASVSKKEVTIEIDSVSAIYGENTKFLTAQVTSGKLYDENAYELDTDVISTTAVGNYSINFTQLNNNYIFTVKNEENSYTVSPADIKDVKINEYSGTFDGALHVSASPSAMSVNMQKVVFTYSTLENGEYTEIAPQFKDAGSYKIYYKINANNHNEIKGSYTVNIEKLEIKIDWFAPENIIYNGESQANKVTASYKDVYSNNVPLNVSFKDANSSITSFVNASNYVATASFANGESNYCLPNGTTMNCKIDRLKVSVVANPLVMTYGDSVPLATWKYADGSNQFVDKDNIQLILNVDATSRSTVGQYDIMFTELINSNYSVSYTNGKLSVEKREIVITVNNQSSIYGQSIKAITGTLTSGEIVNGDSNIYTLYTNATNTSNVNRYDVFETVNNKNYNVVLANSSKAYEIKNAEIQKQTLSSYSGTYDGKAHKGADISLSTVNSQALSYSFTVRNGASYAQMPDFTNAGTYVVDFVASAPNHNDYSGSFTVKIEPKKIEISWTANSFTYNGEKQTVEAWYLDVNSEKIGLAVSMNKEFKSAGNDYVATASFANGESNYSLPSNVINNYQIKKLAVSVIADSLTMIYGDSVPSLTWKYADKSNQFVAADNVILKLTTAATATSDVDSYSIVFEKNTLDNYQVSYTDGSLTVNQRAIEITAINQNSIYGDAIKVISGTVTSGKIVNGDADVYTLYTNAKSTSDAGQYDVFVTVKNANYKITLKNGSKSYEVRNASLILNNVSGYNNVYDGKAHSGTISMNSVNSQAITYKFTVNSTNEYTQMPSFTDVGTYEIRYVASAPNHNDYEGNITVKINPKEIEIQFTENDFIYNGEKQTVEAWYFDVDGKKVSLKVSMNKEFKNASSSYIATASFAKGETNYVLPSATTKGYEIKKLNVTVIADSFEVGYSEDIPTLTWSYGSASNAFVEGDNITLTLNTEAIKGSDAGEYNVTFVQIANSNYNVSYIGGIVKINPIEVEIQFTENDFTYNGEMQTVEAWYFDVDGEKVSLKVSMNKEFKNAASDYIATASFAKGETNYVLPSATTKGYEIKKLNVTVIADSVEIVYSDEIPQLTWSYLEGSAEFIASDNIILTLKTEATVNSNAGEYDIAFDEISIDNYDITYTNGTLTILRKEITVKGITAIDKEYDGTSEAELDFSNVIIEGKTENDTVTVTAKGRFEDSEIGENKTVYITDVTLDEISLSNYVLANEGNQDKAEASITQPNN